MNNFKAHTVEEQATALAQYLPNDKLFSGKNIEGDDLRNLLLGFGAEIQRIDELFQIVWDNTNILTTNDEDFIKLWESAVRIPDHCIPLAKTIEERKANILLKLRSLGVLTAQDFINLGNLLGFNITITPLSDLKYPPYPVPFIPVGEGFRFVAIVKGDNIVTEFYPPYDVPFIPIKLNTIIQCLFDELKPAMTRFIYMNN